MQSAEQETRLRDLLNAKPESAKLMAQLSILLTERAKESNSNDEAVQKEALTLARKSALLCPTRPAGYLALSTASPHFEERLQSLQAVVNLWNPTCSMTPSALAGALVRLLVEPREEEGRRQAIARTSSKHSSRRELDDKESELYQKIQDTLQLAGSEASTQTTESTIYLARIEYRLGLLFRKMLPPNVYRPQCVTHLTSAVEKLPHDHSLVSTARFWLATQVPDGEYEFAMDRCPKDYIVNLYSTFADKFDNLLVDKLSYETPTKLRELVDSTDLTSNEKKWSSAADLGCGTGLSGLAFRDCVDKLTGVDLSPEMIAKARERDCYETLVVGDVASILNIENEFDLVFACDVFVYIGDLAELFTAVKRTLKPDGVFAFSTEHLEEEAKHRYVLHACARFAHKRSYIESLASDNGFEIVRLQICPIRKNGGKDVAGLLAIFKK